MLNHFTRTTVLLLILAAASRADSPWLLAFPEISTDDNRVYFSNDEWTGYYSTGLDVMLTLPRDSVNPPEDPLPKDFCALDAALYQCGRGQITRTFGGLDTMMVFDEPSQSALHSLALVAGDNASKITSTVEVSGPALAAMRKVWFGLSLQDPNDVTSVGGIGWYDPRTGNIVRVYSEILGEYKPVWIGVQNDTIYALFNRQLADLRTASILIGLAPKSARIFEVNLPLSVIPGQTVLSVETWKNAFLIATDQAVAIWSPGGVPRVWATRAYTCREITPLYLRRFDRSRLDTVNFLPLLPGQLSVVSAAIDEWYQLATPRGIEAYVEDDDWAKHSKQWAESDWGCENPCFARVRVPSKNSYLLGDVWNSPLIYIGNEPEGVKVGLNSAWAPRGSLIPVLVPNR